MGNNVTHRGPRGIQSSDASAVFVFSLSHVRWLIVLKRTTNETLCTSTLALGFLAPHSLVPDNVIHAPQRLHQHRHLPPQPPQTSFSILHFLRLLSSALLLGERPGLAWDLVPVWLCIEIRPTRACGCVRIQMVCSTGPMPKPVTMRWLPGSPAWQVLSSLMPVGMGMRTRMCRCIPCACACGCACEGPRGFGHASALAFGCACERGCRCGCVSDFAPPEPGYGCDIDGRATGGGCF